MEKEKIASMSTLLTHQTISLSSYTLAKLFVEKFSYSLKLLIEDKGSIFLLVCLSLPRSPEGTLLNLANDERTQIVQVTSFQMRGRDAKGCVFLPSFFSGDIVLSFPPAFLLYLVFLYYSYYSVGVESE